MAAMEATAEVGRGDALGRVLVVENPADGSTVAEVPVHGPGQVGAAAERARAAQPAWAGAGFAERAKVFKRAQRWLLANQDRFQETIAAETGKTYEDAQLEVAVAAQSFGFWAKRAADYLADERVSPGTPMLLGRRIRVRHVPLGLVGVIGPWNYPLVNTFCDCVPALMAGNAVLVKPSDVTPLTTRLVAEMMGECGLPSSVLEVVNGGGPTGEALVDQVDFVMFTGSTATGRSVMERAARSLTPVSLELGGKDPMIVLADADLERAANAAAYYALFNAGQVCISVERVYVEEPVYDEFLARLVQKVESLRQGRPGGPGEVELGALTFAPQLETILAHVRDAAGKGARILTGGEPAPGPGRFYPPTVIADADHGMTCMTEETFGPTIPVMRVADADQAVALANDSDYGLQASIWTRDHAKGERLARKVEAGTCSVNDAAVGFMAFGAPMGGWKSSGVGSRHAAGGIRKYCKTQTVMVNRFPLKRDMHMFPYSPRTTRLMGRFTRLVYGRGADRS